MDFEVIDHNHIVRGPWSNIEGYFRNSRRQLQDWEANPPHVLGGLILLAFSFELLLTWRLIHSLGFSFRIISHTILLTFTLFILELALAKFASEIGIYFKKTGKIPTAVTFFNISLMPLFLICPVYLLSYISGSMAGMTLFLSVLLAFKYFSNCREALEISFEFGKFQSGLILYLVGLLTVAGIGFVLYLSALSLLSDFLAGA